MTAEGLTPSSAASMGASADCSFATGPMGSAAGTTSAASTSASAAGTTHGTKTPEDTSHLGKRRRPLTEEEVGIMNGLTGAVHMVAEACKAPVVVQKTEVPPNLYSLCMSTPGFSDEDLMLALNHLMDNIHHGQGFVLMTEPHRVLWIRQFLAKLRLREAGRI